MAASATDRDLIRHLDQLSEESDVRRDETHVRDAERNIQFLRGQQHPESLTPGAGRRTESQQYRFVMNLVNTTIKRKTALITDSRPQVNISSRGSLKWRNSAEALKRCIAAIWDTESMDQNSARELVRAATVGVSCAVPVWDPSADYGRGAIRIHFYDPRNIAFDPSVTRATGLRDAEYFQTLEVLPLNWIREHYPTRGMEVEPSDQWSVYETKQSQTRAAPILSPMARPYKKNEREVTASATPRALLRHTWMRDFVRDRQGRPMIGTPRILRHTVDASDVCLVDEKMAWSHQQIPGHLFDWDIELDHAWGMSEAGGLRRINYTLNRIIGQVMDNVLTNNRVRVVSDTDAVDPKTWDAVTQNPNGLYVRKRTGRNFEYRSPEGAIPPYVLDFINLLIQAVDIVTGLYDASQGKRPPGVSSGIALEGLQLAAQSIVRLEARAFEDWLERIFMQVIALIWQYYTADRVLATVGPGGVYDQFEFQRSSLTSSDDGAALPQEAWQDFVFKVLPGSSLSSTRMQRGVMAMNLFKAGLLPGVEVLRAAEWPNPDDSFKEAMAEQMAKAQAAAQASGGVTVQQDRKHRGAGQGTMPPMPGQARRSIG